MIYVYSIFLWNIFEGYLCRIRLFWWDNFIGYIYVLFVYEIVVVFFLRHFYRIFLGIIRVSYRKFLWNMFMLYFCRIFLGNMILSYFCELLL